jgi:hypothetical protein
MRAHHLAILLGLLIYSEARADGPTPSQLQAQLAAGSTPPSPVSEQLRALAAETAIANTASTALNLASQAIQADGGDGSRAVVVSSSAGANRAGAVARSLGERFGTMLDERDFGAQCDGSTDDTAAFRAAQNAAQALGGATIRLEGAGRCELQTIYTISNNSWEFGSNLKLDGSVSGVLDDISHVRRTIAFQSSNDVGESNLFLSQDDVASGGSASYQKNGVYVRLFQADPSTYNGVNGNIEQVAAGKDAVAYEAQINIRPGNMAGRVYGYHAQATAESGSDGNINVAELELSNNGSYTPQGARYNSKRVLHLTCIGSADCTEGVDLDGTSRFHIGISSFQNAIRSDGYFLYYGASDAGDLTTTPVFGVAQSGLVSTTGGATVGGGLSADNLTVSGVATLAAPLQNAAQDEVVAAMIAAPASGTPPSGATSLSKAVNRITGCPQGSALQLPAGATAGRSSEIVVLNRSGTSCTIYPPANGQIENNASNMAVSVAAGADQIFRSMSPGTWYQ